jgi:DNA-binding transcriptional MocR family regulator
VANGVIYVAGEAFFVDDSGGDRVRLSFSAPTPERITEGVERFATTVREELEAARKRPRPSVTA